MRLRAGWLIAFFTLPACAPTVTYDLDQPLALAVDYVLTQQRYADAAAWRRQFADVAAQLGGSVTDDPAATSNHLITLVYSPDCDGKKLVPAFVHGDLGHGSPDGDLYLCRDFLEREYLWPQILAHELGHLLGAPHLPCNGRNIMCEVAPRDVLRYSDDDVAAICRYTRGRVCGR